MRFLMMGYEQESERVQAIEQAGHTMDVSEADSEAWQNAARTQYDTIWVNWSEADHSVRPLVQYRTLRPTTRIVVEVPDELEPPDSEVAKWVQLGVYDIARSQSDFSLVIQNPATIADALAWTGLQPVDSDTESSGPKPLKPVQFRTIEVEKKISTSARPVLIAVVGVSPGVGTTTTAVSAATLLAGMGHEVALAESLSTPPALDHWESELPKGVTPFASPAPDPIELVRRREWAYIVVDAGAIPEWAAIREWQADLTVLVGPGDKHRFARWEPLVRAIPEQYGASIVAGAIAGGKDGDKIVRALADEGGLTAFEIPENSHKKGKGGDRALRDLLAPVMADLAPRRRWWAQPSRTAPKPEPETKAEQAANAAWKYTPSPTPAPAYIPPPAPPQSLNIQVARPGVSGFTRLWRLVRGAAELWAIASIIAWVINLWNANTVGTMPGVGGRFAVYASWIISIDRAILHHL